MMRMMLIAISSLCGLMSVTPVADAQMCETTTVRDNRPRVELASEKAPRESRSEKYRRQYRETYNPKNYRENYRKNYRDNRILTDSFDPTFSTRLDFDPVDVGGTVLPEGRITYRTRHERPAEAPPVFDLKPDEIIPNTRSPYVEVEQTPAQQLQQRVFPQGQRFPFMWMQARRWQSLQEERGRQMSAPRGSAGAVTNPTDVVMQPVGEVLSASQSRYEEALNSFHERRYIFSLNQLQEQHVEFPEEPQIQYAYAVGLFASGLIDDSAREFGEAMTKLNAASMDAPDWSSFYGKPADAEVHLNRLQRHVQRNPSDNAARRLFNHLTATNSIPTQ